MNISVMIATRNRRDELRRTLAKLLELDQPADEILVCADGCTDDTSDMVGREFPSCVLLQNDSSRGSIFSRDRLLRTATGEIVASFDDDSYPLDRDFFARVRNLFATYPDAAVISFPELRDDKHYADPTKSPSASPHLISAYANCAAVMRRDVYLRSDGFPEFFGHMYEEPDYALQCYALGYVVRFEPSLTIRHHETPRQRDPMRRHHLNARNELWSVLMRCPFPQAIAVALFRIWRQFRYAWSEGAPWALSEPRWWLSALRGIPNCIRHRRPIPWRKYYAWMKIARTSY
jgi:GT2 family glycosyltransferase